ncbi:cell division protein PerM [Sphaerisporangium aureirubrum]|uniref:DUF6350 family protein n=1 Tax=Sphaerisporangium aureirubrum TaxID=1544736 RepID=A0ABW1NDH1_9ACTN
MTALFDQLRAGPRSVLNRIPFSGGTGDDDETRRPLPVSGMLAAAWTLGVGLAVLTTLTLIGWIAAPRGAFGQGVAEVFRAACQVWLAAHHAGFAIPGGRVGLLPLGLSVLPAALLYRAALWMARDADLRLRMPARLPKGSTKDLANARRRAQLVLIAQAGVSLAAPYAMLAGVIALVARNELTQPFMGEALLSHLVLAFAAGSLATARTIGPWRSMLRLLPERPRALVAGTAVALLTMLGAGLVLVVVALGTSFGQVRELSDFLAPGVIGGVLLLLVQALYLPNLVIWGLAYLSGPGFAIGTGTLVAPTGVQLGSVPALPVLGALPDPGVTSPLLMSVLAVPFVAGAIAGVVVARVAPTPQFESAPLWGFGCGLATGLASGLLAALAGGPLGGARLSAVGPSAWEVALSVTLEVGVAAGISAGLANWWSMFHGARSAPAPVRMADEVIAKVTGKIKPSAGLPGHWMNATEADTQPIPAIRDDWSDEHTPFDPTPVVPRPAGPLATAPPHEAGDPEARRDIVDETDDRGGHVIYVDPYAWDRDS